MRAIVLPSPGESLTLEELPDPRPSFGEVLVSVAACGVCHTDLHVMKGEVAFPSPSVLGHEISGVIVELGDGVDGLRVGDRVVSSFIMPCAQCAFCRSGEEELCERFFNDNRLRGVLYDGTSRLRRFDGQPIAMYSMAGLAELSVVPATDVFVLPDNVALQDACVLGCAFFTAYGAVRHVADLRPGASVAVVAVGGVGSAIVQLARVFGARQIIAIDIDDEKLGAAKTAGATDLVNSRSTDVAESVRAITNGRGVDVVFEALGTSQTIATSLALLRDGGLAVLVGIAPSGVEASFIVTPLVRRKLRICGSYGARPKTDMPVLIDMAARGAINLAGAISQRFSLADAPTAYDLLSRGSIIGRAIIEISSPNQAATGVQ